MVKNRPRYRWQDVLSVTGLAALTAAFFWKLIFSNLILAGLDVFGYFYPYREFAAHALREGRLPLWNPYLFMGVPFLANIQTAVLYPLNGILAGLPTPQLVSASIVLHVFLAAAFTYAFARRTLHLPPFSSFGSAICFAFGGFLGAQVEHVNQLNVTAWLPLLFLCLDELWQTSRLYANGTDSPPNTVSDSWRPRLGAGLCASVVIALQLLAGHTQAAYIVLVAAGLYALLAPVVSGLVSGRLRAWRPLLRAIVLRLVLLVGVVILGSLLSAAQLLPTLELSGLSYRSGGLPYREAASFSLRPQLLLQSLLPPYALDLSQVFGASFSEFVAYAGIASLLLAIAGWIWGRRSQRHVFGLSAAIGLFLALGVFNPVYYLLYRIVPGFALFRAPARWMLLYSFGVSLLVGYGIEAIFAPGFSQRVRATVRGIRATAAVKKATRWAVVGLLLLLVPVAYFLDIPDFPTLLIWTGVLLITLFLLLLIASRRLPEPIGQIALILLVCGELFWASRGLAYNNPTAPQAYEFLRPAPAFLLTDPGQHRFISMSSTTYDPGDLREIETIFGWQLPERAVYDYIVAVKRKEVLAYNLPLHFGLYVVDGYDGGLLPLKRFVELQQLFLPEDQVSADGRLREQLKDIPESRLLAILNVKYVLTDKVYDVWIDDVFYDLQFTARLGPGLAEEIGTEDILPDTATALGVISYLRGAAELPDGTPVAEIVVTNDQGNETHHLLRAGLETAEGEYTLADAVRHAQARVGHNWRDNLHGNDYVAIFEFEQPRIVKKITVRGLIPTGEFDLRAISLIDRRTFSNRSVLLSTSGRYRLVYSGDVKIYENLDNMPRAFLVHEARVIDDDLATVAAMADPAFRPEQTVILAASPERQAEIKRGTDTVEIVTYDPECVTLEVDAGSAGYLVLTDTYYPGWEAEVNGRTVPIYRANLTSRAIALDAGHHQVVFSYRPHTFYTGTAISLLTLLATIIGLIRIRVRRYRKD